MCYLVSSGYCYVLLICWLATRHKKSVTIIKTLWITLKYRPCLYFALDHGGFAFLHGGSAVPEAPRPDGTVRVWVKTKSFSLFQFYPSQ